MSWKGVQNMTLPKNLRYSLGPLGRILFLIGIVLLIPIPVGIYYSDGTF